MSLALHLANAPPQRQPARQAQLTQAPLSPWMVVGASIQTEMS